MSAVVGVWVVPAGEFAPAEFGTEAWVARGEGDNVVHVADLIDARDVSAMLVPWNPSGYDGGATFMVAVFVDEDDARTWVEGRTGQKILPKSVYMTS